MRIKEQATEFLRHDQLTDADLSRLRTLPGDQLAVTRTGAGWKLKNGSLAGVLTLDRVRLLLEPKFAISGKRLVDWLCYANGVPVPHEETLRRWRTGTTGYAELVLPALLTECKRLLDRGLRRAYVPGERVEPVLRGRIDVRAQAVRRYGAVNRLHVKTFEHSAVTWENLVCGAALTTAARMASDPNLAHDLRKTAACFPNPRLPHTAPRLLDNARYTRLNAHYRDAHVWARLVLEGGRGGVTDLLADQGARAGSLLLRLSGLWELAVRQMATEAATHAGGRLADCDEGKITTVGRLNGRAASFRPDLLLAFGPPGSAQAGHAAGATRFLAVDAKYKAHATDEVDSGDRHQLLTYIAGYTTPDCPLAIIVHPAPHGATHRKLRIEGPRGRLGVIEVIGLDTRLAPSEAAEPLREAMARFATSGS